EPAAGVPTEGTQRCAARASAEDESDDRPRLRGTLLGPGRHRRRAAATAVGGSLRPLTPDVGERTVGAATTLVHSGHPHSPHGGAPLSEPRDPGSLDEAKEAITARGREKGFVTSEDLLEVVPVEDVTPEQVEELLTQLQEFLSSE